MTEQEARELIVQAGHKLVDTGLVAGTWGNISCRLDDESFLITPEGKAYDTLMPEDMAVCKISDASHTGDAVPPSEKGIHALIYRERSNAGFVVHTHQKWASAIAASDVGEVNGAPVAAYGFGSKKLIRSVGGVLLEANDSLLLKRHGAVCFGADCGEALEAARKLEEDCQRLIIEAYIKKSGDKRPQDLRRIFDYCAGVSDEADCAEPPLKAESRRDGDGFIFVLGGEEQHYTRLSAYMPEEAKLHETVYRARPDVCSIKASDDDAVLSLSCGREPLLPMLDDFAQCVGTSAKIAKSGGISAALSGRRGAALIAGRGALCCSDTGDGATDIKLIVEKTAATMLTSKLFGETKPLPLSDCVVRRIFYIKKSKLVNK